MMDSLPSRGARSSAHRRTSYRVSATDQVSSSRRIGHGMERGGPRRHGGRTRREVSIRRRLAITRSMLRQAPIPRENPSNRSAAVGRTHPTLLRRLLPPAAPHGAPVFVGADRYGLAKGRWLLDRRSVQDLPPPRAAAWRDRGRRRGALPAGPTGSPKDPARSA